MKPYTPSPQKTDLEDIFFFGLPTLKVVQVLLEAWNRFLGIRVCSGRGSVVFFPVEVVFKEVDVCSH